jgi:hypothetical protein
MNESAATRKHLLCSCAVARYELQHYFAVIGSPRRSFAAAVRLIRRVRRRHPLQPAPLRCTRPNRDSRAEPAQLRPSLTSIATTQSPATLSFRGASAPSTRALSR